MEVKDASYLIFLIVLLPIIPAFILFKFLPESSKAEATGPYQKLKIKLGGAFAGYFILALLLSGLLSRYFLVVPESDYEFWTVRGQIGLASGELKSEMFIVQPPMAEPTGSEFIIRGVPVHRKQQDAPPLITIQLPGVGPLYIRLEEDSPFPRNYTVQRDETKRTFIVSVDSLSNIEESYSEEEGVEAVPVPVEVEDVAPDSLEGSGTSS